MAGFCPPVDWLEVTMKQMLLQRRSFRLELCSAGLTCIAYADALDVRVDEWVLSRTVGYWTINIGQASLVQHPARR